MAMITLVEYARRNGKDAASARHKAQRGGFQTAIRLGRDWMIDEDEPYTDRRIRSGDYIGARVRQKEEQDDNE